MTGSVVVCALTQARRVAARADMRAFECILADFVGEFPVSDAGSMVDGKDVID